MTSQYDEDEIISQFFRRQHPKDGWNYLVDIGAADGVDNSNSRKLLEWSWEGLLVEPNPQYFRDLLKLYSPDANEGNKSVRLSNYAISNITGRRKFYLNNQCSSLMYPIGYQIEVEAITLTDLFELYKVPSYFDFLSIDCEGSDMDILQSLDWKRWKVDLICIEYSMDKKVLDVFMKNIGYKVHKRTQGNSFFERI